MVAKSPIFLIVAAAAMLIVDATAKADGHLSPSPN
jgi:hypothetical protein